MSEQMEDSFMQSLCVLALLHGVGGGRVLTRIIMAPQMFTTTHIMKFIVTE